MSDRNFRRSSDHIVRFTRERSITNGTLISKRGEELKCCSSPRDAFASASLEVKSHDDLDHAPANVIRGREVLIGVGGLTESRSAKVGHAGIRGCLAAYLEVDVVEGIQELSPRLKGDSFSNIGLLDQADIEPGQAWPVEHQVCKPALAHKSLYA